MIGRRLHGQMYPPLFLHHADGLACVQHLPKDTFSPGCTQACGRSVLVSAIFSWGTLKPIVLVDETLTGHTYLNIVTDQVHPFMAIIFPGGDGVFQ